jgi:hypothetical protein
VCSGAAGGRDPSPGPEPPGPMIVCRKSFQLVRASVTSPQFKEEQR